MMLPKGHLTSHSRMSGFCWVTIPVQFGSVQSLSHVHSLWPHGLQHTRLPCPSSTYGAYSNSCPSNHLILCHLLLLLASIFPRIRVFSKESVLIRWPKYRSFRFSISHSNEYSGLISFRIDWSDVLAAKGLSRVFSNTRVPMHQFSGAQLSLKSNSHIHTWLLEKP